MPAELNTLEAARTLVDQSIERFGRLNAVVHVLGGFAGGKPAEETDDATIERMLDLNFRPAFHMLRAALPALRASGSGRFVAIGARAAVEPPSGLSAYSSSKAALLALVRTVALENKDKGVTANVVLPGTMDTPANRSAMPGADFTRWVDPNKVAALVAWLVSDGASEVSGAAIPVYGKEA